MEGYNATVFAYGITSSGKTHTIFGRNGGGGSGGGGGGGVHQRPQSWQRTSSGVGNEPSCEKGISLLAIEYLLTHLDMKKT